MVYLWPLNLIHKKDCKVKIELMKCKIHRATVTDANLNYEGSITIDKDLCRLAGLHEFEKVDIVNCNNGERLTTYVILGSDGDICLNGAAARKVHKGDKVIIMAYGQFEESEAHKHKPKIVFVNDKNNLK